jgi:hypothetical protein
MLGAGGLRWVPASVPERRLSVCQEPRVSVAEEAPYRMFCQHDSPLLDTESAASSRSGF